MTQAPSTKSTKIYDLEERTAKLGEAIIELCKKISKSEITRPIVYQPIKAVTSVGANYCEADDAVSKRGFKNKIGICKKESREAKHFLRMLAKAVPSLEDEIKVHWQEAKELNLIFNSIYKKVKQIFVYWFIGTYLDPCLPAGRN